MSTITVELPEKSYPVHIAEHLLPECGETIKEIYSGKKIFVLSDDDLWSIHGQTLMHSLRLANFEPEILILPHGEGNKSMESLKKVLCELSQRHVNRSHLLLTFGGGVIGDLGGFCAAIYMRGMDYIHIPTTLLAQVDSSIGGKTGINLPDGKNLAGAFWQPRMVLSDPSLLSTLNETQFADGMAEIIKYAALFSEDLFQRLEHAGTRKNLTASLPKIIEECCELKAKIVALDERDHEKRKLLNFGHSFGHAIETLGGFQRFTHGQAISMGMVLAASYGEDFGKTKPGTSQRISALCEAYLLPVHCPWKRNDLLSSMGTDKKNEGSSLSLVLLSEIGNPFLEKELKIDHFPTGIVVPPPSKSIAHRMLICTTLAMQALPQTLYGEDCEDIRATKRCLTALFPKTPKPTDQISILDCGDSASTLRFLLPLVGLLGKPARFTGSKRLMERLSDPYYNCLSAHGMCIVKKNAELFVSGTLQAGDFSLPGDLSSQFVTGLLFTLPLLPSSSTLNIEGTLESKPYVDLTLEVLSRFGISVTQKTTQLFLIEGGQTYRIPPDCHVEADYSAAAFFLVASALGCPVAVKGLTLDSLQGDRKFLSLLALMGAEIKISPENVVSIREMKGKPITVDVSDIPDLAPPLAVLMALCPGESRLINASRLRLKESDRLSSITCELRNLGADITEGDNELIIRGKERLSGGFCSSHGDHRIAMMCAVAAIQSEQPVFLSDADCVSKSYPAFWRDFLKERKV